MPINSYSANPSETQTFYGALNSANLLVLNAKASVVTNLAPNLQTLFMGTIFLQKNGATKLTALANVVEHDHVTI